MREAQRRISPARISPENGVRGAHRVIGHIDHKPPCRAGLSVEAQPETLPGEGASALAGCEIPGAHRLLTPRRTDTDGHDVTVVDEAHDLRAQRTDTCG